MKFEIFKFRQYLENQGFDLVELSLEEIPAIKSLLLKADSQDVQDYIEARIDPEAREEALADLGITYPLSYKASLLYMMAKVELSHIRHQPAYFVKEWLLGLPYIVDLPSSYEEQREQLKNWGLGIANMQDIDISNIYYTLIASAIKHAASLEKEQATILQQAL